VVTLYSIDGGGDFYRYFYQNDILIPNSAIELNGKLHRIIDNTGNKIYDHSWGTVVKTSHEKFMVTSDTTNGVEIFTISYKEKGTD